MGVLEEESVTVCVTVKSSGKGVRRKGRACSGGGVESSRALGYARGYCRGGSVRFSVGFREGFLVRNVGKGCSCVNCRAVLEGVFSKGE